MCGLPWWLSGKKKKNLPSNAENADNLEEAILCYMQYGEYDPDELWEELKMGEAAHS